jgi:hypothetical protein
MPTCISVTPAPQLDRAQQFRQQVLRAYRIADEAVAMLVYSECVATDAQGAVWFDTAPLTDPREYAPTTCDSHALWLAYGLDRLVLRPHPATPALVRLAPRPPAAGGPSHTNT